MTSAPGPSPDICPNCGGRCYDGSNFCHRCGHLIHSSAANAYKSHTRTIVSRAEHKGNAVAFLQTTQFTASWRGYATAGYHVAQPHLPITQLTSSRRESATPGYHVTQPYIALPAKAGNGFRFCVGDRVSCRTDAGRNGWATGRVVALHYREDDWAPGQTVPYQIALDERFGGHLIYAPHDTPNLIRSARDGPQATVPFPAVGNASTAHHALMQEVSVIRRLPFVLKADMPSKAPVVERCGELVTPTAATGPWLVSVLLAGPQGSFYEGEYRINILCNAAWPQSPPEVRICSIIHHACVDEEGLVDADLLAEAAATSTCLQHRTSGCWTGGMCAALHAVHWLLVNPMALLPEITHAQMKVYQERNQQRQQVIASYRQLRRCPRLFDAHVGWAPEWFDTSLLSACKCGTPQALRDIVREEASEIYSFPLFAPAFCSTLIAELENFSASSLGTDRPNGMNRYGVVVNDIGLEPMVDRLQDEVLQPLAHLLFPGVGSLFHKQHAFVVRYKMGEDLGLDMHTDDSDVTFNVCLGKEFDGAGLQFCGNQGEATHRQTTLKYKHQLGRCVVHLGHRRHGADDITQGERLNLIIWSLNSEYRASRLSAKSRHQSADAGYEREAGPPDRLCLSFTHDRDYGVFKNFTASNVKHMGKGWCPPSHAEYAGFRAASSDQNSSEVSKA
eukprot:TRINITY_DN91398_c0_g1_i1.p1 TRINITY_DN91398_c0_g1~~TRINITY_DN91398_c0_g1_i1.p1  ORF type:complete len:676 (-),score=68.99 TRINITY_DN91398_c0_g1_i1:45-2072(-)